MSHDKSQGVDALNQDFRRYEQVEKEQEYRLAETAAAGRDEEFDDDFEVRACDMARLRSGRESDRRRFVADLGSALEEIGFAILTGHGVDTVLWDRAEEKTLALFRSVSLDDKLRFRAARVGSVSQGYFPIKETSEIHPDLVEGWVFCRRAFDLGTEADFDAADFWPLPEIEPVFRELVQTHERLVIPLFASLLEYLGSEPDLYDERLTGTNFGLRLNYYPPIGSDDDVPGAGRLLGHEDVDLFTLLPAPKVEGLQVLNRRNGKWVRLAPPAGSIILNAGDYLQRISNDRLPSTTHRVSKPRDPADRARARVSMPMAIYLWEDEMLEVLPSLAPARYEPIKAIAFHTRSTAKFYGDDYAVDD